MVLLVFHFGSLTKEFSIERKLKVLKTLGLKILDGTPNYYVIEDIGRISSITHFEKLLQEIMEYVTEKGTQSVSIVLNEKEAANTDYLDLLEAFDFWQQETQYFYKRDLSSFKEHRGILEKVGVQHFTHFPCTSLKKLELLII